MESFCFIPSAGREGSQRQMRSIALAGASDKSVTSPTDAKNTKHRQSNKRNKNCPFRFLFGRSVCRRQTEDERFRESPSETRACRRQ